MPLSALGRPLTTFDHRELYLDLFTKAAALLDSLMRNHPYVDGKKRTAITAAGIFLWINHYRLTVENEEMVGFALACAQSQLSMDEITDWFIQHSSAVVEYMNRLLVFQSLQKALQ